MRKALFAAAAVAPLCAAALHGAAHAQTTISNSRNTPIATSTANNGQPSDVVIASGGSITVTGTTPAVTLDSSNTVTNQGSISIKDVDNATGVLVEGGNTGSMHNAGTISVTESYSASSDSNGDGAIQPPWAKGTGRYGVRVVGTSPFVGDISNDSGGTITVKGNNSYGISVEAPLQGNLTNAGVISFTGDNGAAIRTTNTVSGNVTVTGSITATGASSNGINIGGDVGGRVGIYSTVTETAYGTTTRPTDPTALTNIQKTSGSTSSEVEQGGPAVVIGGNVAGGVFIGEAPSGTVSGSTADVDADGVADGSEGTGVITSFGTSPALLIGATGRDVALGEFGGSTLEEKTQPANAYGLIVRGTVTGSGLYDGVTATGLQVGTGDGTVHIAGGARIVGTVSANSYEADATGTHILSGAVVPEVRVEGTLSAVINHSVLTTNGGPAVTATALLIDSGGQVSTLTNTGTISATANGDKMSAAAVVDRGGGISTVTNEGVIAAGISAVTTGVTPSGSTIALDLRANTTGVTLTQMANPNTSTVAGNASGSSTTATTAVTPPTPSIGGDVLLGNGPNTVQLLAGSMSGALDLGSGVSSLTIDNGATYLGSLRYSGPALTLNVNNGALTDSNPATIKTASLNVGSSGTLIFGIDPVNNQATNFQVAGTATLANGAKLGIDVLSTLTGPQTYTLISATHLNDQGSDTSLLSQVPYLFAADIHSDAAAGTVTLDLRRRTAAEMGLNPAQSAALDPVYSALSGDAAVQSAVLSATTQAGFLKLYNQFLPDYTGGAFQFAAAASQAVSRAVGGGPDMTDSASHSGLWAQEVVVGVQRKGDASIDGYNGGGFGFAGGAQTSQSALGALGVNLSFIAGGVHDPANPGEDETNLTELQLGVYWKVEAGGLRADARIAAGYDWFSTQRELLQVTSSGATALERTSKGKSSGYSAVGAFGLAYQADFGRFYIRPRAQLDYYRLQEGSYTETGGGNAFDLALQSRTGEEARLAGSLALGAKFGSGLQWRPELELGYQDVFAGNAGDITARFASGGNSFTLTPPAVNGSGPLARLGLKAVGEVFEIGLEAGAQTVGRYREGDVKATVKVMF